MGLAFIMPGGVRMEKGSHAHAKAARFNLPVSVKNMEVVLDFLLQISRCDVVGKGMVEA